MSKLKDASNQAIGQNGESLDLHHIGMAVLDLDAAIETYCQLFGAKIIHEPVHVPHEKVRVCFLRLSKGVFIELVASADPNSPIEKVLTNQGEGPYHLCYKVDDMKSASRYFKSKGCFTFRRFKVPEHNLKFAFLLTPEQQVFEICERIDKTIPWHT